MPERADAFAPTVDETRMCAGCGDERSVADLAYRSGAYVCPDCD